MESLNLSFKKTLWRVISFRWLFLSLPLVLFLNENGKLKKKQSSFFLIIMLGSLIKLNFELENSWWWLEFPL